MDCYGKQFNRLPSCETCAERNYCRDAGDVTYLTPNEIFDVHAQEGAENFMYFDDSSNGKNYETEATKNITAFFLSLDVVNFQILQSKYNNPTVSLETLAQRLDMSRQAVHKRIVELCSKTPSLKRFIMPKKRTHKRLDEDYEKNVKALFAIINKGINKGE